MQVKGHKGGSSWRYKGKAQEGPVISPSKSANWLKAGVEANSVSSPPMGHLKSAHEQAFLGPSEPSTRHEDPAPQTPVMNPQSLRAPPGMPPFFPSCSPTISFGSPSLLQDQLPSDSLPSHKDIQIEDLTSDAVSHNIEQLIAQF